MIKSSACPLHIFKMLLCPHPNSAKSTTQAETQVSELVLDLWRDERVYSACNQAFARWWRRRFGMSNDESRGRASNNTLLEGIREYAVELVRSH